MADSYVFAPADKVVREPRPRNPLREMPQYDISPVTPDVFDSLDTRDAYDLCFGDDWLSDLNPQQALMVLKRTRQMYLSEINKIQKEIDRISILELPNDDPRVHTPWPRYYELRAKKERKQ